MLTSIKRFYLIYKESQAVFPIRDNSETKEIDIEKGEINSESFNFSYHQFA